ncbi:hypothetical protein AAE021_01755 [Arthrobacter citreus]|uniref:Uncharacterized protein n=1 Tax=Arthrobacter citreus TaxID=1670 RepID=A0ABZ2ZZR6_9MICC
MSPRKPHRRASGGSAPKPVTPSQPSQSSEESRAPAEPSVLKAKAADDDPRVWGDGPEDRDSWLLEQRPPHWD